MTDANTPIPLKVLNDMDRQAADAQKLGKPVKLSSYMVRCVITELKTFRSAAKVKALRAGYRAKSAQSDYEKMMRNVSKKTIRTESRIDGDRRRE